MGLIMTLSVTKWTSSVKCWDEAQKVTWRGYGKSSRDIIQFPPWIFLGGVEKNTNHLPWQLNIRPKFKNRISREGAHYTFCSILFTYHLIVLYFAILLHENRV